MSKTDKTNPAWLKEARNEDLPTREFWRDPTYPRPRASAPVKSQWHRVKRRNTKIVLAKGQEPDPLRPRGALFYELW